MRASKFWGATDAAMGVGAELVGGAIAVGTTNWEISFSIKVSLGFLEAVAGLQYPSRTVWEDSSCLAASTASF